MDEFKIGDLVQLKSGGPAMTVTVSPTAWVTRSYGANGLQTIGLSLIPFRSPL
jgi:uncharacterized protein YodC (DUF2158 family)